MTNEYKKVEWMIQQSTFEGNIITIYKVLTANLVYELKMGLGTK